MYKSVKLADGSKIMIVGIKNMTFIEKIQEDAFQDWPECETREQLSKEAIIQILYLLDKIRDLRLYEQYQDIKERENNLVRCLGISKEEQERMKNLFINAFCENRSISSAKIAVIKEIKKNHGCSLRSARLWLEQNILNCAN